MRQCFRILVLGWFIAYSVSPVSAEDAESLYWVGAGYHDHRVYAGALYFYTQALREDPEFTEALTARAKVFAQIGYFEEALLDLNRAIKLGDASQEVVVTRARVLHALGDTDAAIKLFQRVLRQRPRAGDVWLYLGHALFDSGAHEEAIEAYTRAIERNPFSQEAYSGRAQAYTAAGRMGEALRDAEQAVTLNPKVAEGYLTSARVQIAEGDYAAALHALAGARQVAPDDKALPWRIAESLHKAGEHDAAADWYLRLLSDASVSETDRRYLWSELGRLFIEGERIGAAVFCYDRLLASDASASEFRLARASLLQRMGKDAEAEADYSVLIRESPAEASLYGYRSQLRLKREAWQAALEDLDRALALGPATAQLYANRALVHQRFENYPAMLENLEAAILLAEEPFRAKLESMRQGVAAYLEAVP